MKAIIGNKIYMVVEPALHKKLEKELTYKIPSYNHPDNFIEIKNLRVINFNINGGNLLVAIPVGRTDLIPDNYTIEDKRVLAPVDFPEFGFELRKSQQEVVDDITDNCIINAKVSWGKAQPGDSLIRVPNGWETMRNIRVGDAVLGPDNKQYKILDKFYHENKAVYKITFQDGRVVEACGEHLWETINDNKVTKIMTTEEILQSNYFKRKKLYIPLCSPISDDNDNKLPLHPYLLGFLLGDGGFSARSIMFSTADNEIIDKLRTIIPKDHSINHASNYDYRIVGAQGGSPGCNSIINYFKQVGLMGCTSENKFIPEEYEFISLENKMQLLQGLFDADGYVDNGNKIEYCTTSLELANSIAKIVFSLGGQCSIRSKKTSYTYNGEKLRGKLAYILCVKRLPYDIKTQLFSLERKKSKIRPGQYDNSNKLRIESIEFKGFEDCWCIAIEGSSKLYLTDNYIVTHNTFTGINLAKKLGQKTLVVVHTVDLRNQWEREVVKTLGIKPGIIGSGKYNIDAPIVIANIQSLSKYINSLKREFGTVILDEMHHVSSPTFSKFIDTMYSRYKIGLSGTIERKDQKHVVFKDYFGNKVYKPERENSMIPRVEVVHSGIAFPDGYNAGWADKVTALSESYLYRNLIIALAEAYVKQGHTVVVTSDRLDFIHYCNETCDSPSVALVGGMKDRESVIQEVETGKAKIVWASQNIISEGISINKLSCLVLGTPLNNMPLLEQLIGRIVRKLENKPTPVICDVKLEGFTVSNQYNNRLGHYMKEGYKIDFLK